MRVRDLYRRDVIRAAAEESLAEAAARMSFEEIGALAVFEGSALVGIITERDVVRAVGDGIDPSSVSVRDYMTPEPVTVTPDASAAEAAATMILLGARHLPVTEGGEVVGMISVRDLLVEEAQER